MVIEPGELLAVVASIVIVLDKTNGVKPFVIPKSAFASDGVPDDQFVAVSHLSPLELVHSFVVRAPRADGMASAATTTSSQNAGVNGRSTLRHHSPIIDAKKTIRDIHGNNFIFIDLPGFSVSISWHEPGMVEPHWSAGRAASRRRFLLDAGTRLVGPCEAQSDDGDFSLHVWLSFMATRWRRGGIIV